MREDESCARTHVLTHTPAAGRLKPLVQQYAKELVVIMRVYFEKVEERSVEMRSGERGREQARASERARE